MLYKIDKFDRNHKTQVGKNEKMMNFLEKFCSIIKDSDHTLKVCLKAAHYGGWKVINEAIHSSDISSTESVFKNIDKQFEWISVANLLCMGCAVDTLKNNQKVQK
eukprot:UN26503